MPKKAALFQSGMALVSNPTKARVEAGKLNGSGVSAFSTKRTPKTAPVAVAATLATLDDNKDHFITRDGRVFAGTHLLIELWGASRLDELEHVENTLRDCVTAAKATLLHIHLHHFTPNGGISGVAVLAESHISIHSWPERGYAALDVFMCGDSRPEVAVPVLEQAFSPDRTEVSTFYRGEIVQPCKQAAE